MTQITNHKWVNQLEDGEAPPCPLIADHVCEEQFQEDILAKMLSMGIDRDKTLQVLFPPFWHLCPVGRCG